MQSDDTNATEAQDLDVRGLSPHQLFSIDGRVAIVTGAAGGIGSWLCAGLASAGARVLATDRDAEGLEVLARALLTQGHPIDAMVVDLDDDDSAERIVRHAVGLLGAVDILVNNAGINRRVPMLDLDRASLEHIWCIDYLRCYELSQAAVRAMIERGNGGSIIHISSLNSVVGLEGVSALGPAKAALSQLAKVMTVEFARFGIRTNAIAPGFMATPMNASHWEHPHRAPWILGRTPLSRPGHPSELVGAALLLASDAGSFISGQTLFVDGGFTAGSRWNVGPEEAVESYRGWVASGSSIGSHSP